MMSNPCNNQ